jgi:hypothetical protein
MLDAATINQILRAAWTDVEVEQYPQVLQIFDTMCPESDKPRFEIVVTVMRHKVKRLAELPEKYKRLCAPRPRRKA